MKRLFLAIFLLLALRFPLLAQGPPGPPPNNRNRLTFKTPPGKWWNDSGIVTRLGITPEQQRKMEALFNENRLKLIDLTATLDKENLLLDPLLDTDPVNESKVNEQVERIISARGELERVNSRFLLAVRKVLTQDQWRKLQMEKPSLPPPAKGNLE